MTHSIVWTFNDGSVEPEATCGDEECLNRYSCEHDCEVYYDVRREPDGAVTHAQWDDGTRPIIERHQMHKGDHCHLIEFLNADPFLLTELNDGHQRFEIGRTDIEPVWGGDGALWCVRESADERSGS